VAARSRLALAAVAFAAAAALSAWNPLAAPFGLVVGVVSAALALRALQQGARRWVASAALALSLAAMIASGIVLALTAGVGREPTGGAVVDAPPPAEASKALDAARDRTEAARKRARDELGKVGGGPSGPSR
jgi:hypothetical protein